MGIISSVKSGAKSVYNSAKNKIGTTKGLLGTNYRTSVLNDFSIVSKAVFYVLGHKKSDTTKYEFIKALPVQINPDHLYHVSDRKLTHQGCISGGGGKSKFGFDSSSTSESIDIRVIYDIYDDYVAGGEFIGKDISLLNPDYTSLPELIDLAAISSSSDQPKDDKVRVLFKWGEIKHFGILTSASVDYTAFSRWGSPLKAEATFSMTVVAMPEKSDIGEAMNDVNSYTLLSDNLNVATLAGLAGAKELGGLALGVVQSLRT